jgi:hypothetical protein
MGCRVLIFARGCWFNTIDFNFSEVVTPAVEAVGSEAWGRVFDAIYILDAHETAFSEFRRSDASPLEKLATTPTRRTRSRSTAA